MGDYTIQSGDTLSGIARDLGIPLGALLESNPGIANPDRIKAGEPLKLPSYGPGSSEVHFDPATNPQHSSPFSKFPTAGAGSPMPGEPSAWRPQPGTLQPAGPMGMTQPTQPGEAQAAQSPFAWGSENRPAGIYPDHLMNRVYETGKNVVQGVGDFVTDKIPRAMRGEMSEEEMAGFGVESALMTMGGGAFGTRAGAAAARPLPMGNPRHLPSQTPATGTMGLAQRAQRSGALNDAAAIDPMWIDTVMMGRPPTGNVRGGPTPGVTLGSGPVKDGNVIRPNFGEAQVPKDPKTNLERRMAKRGVGNEVTSQNRFFEAQTDGWIKKDTKQRLLDRTANMSKKQEGQAARNKPVEIMSKATQAKKLDSAKGPKDPATMATKGETKHLRKLMKLREEYTKGTPLSEAKKPGDIQKRLDQITDLLADLKNPEFPVVAGGVAGAGAYQAATSQPEYGVEVPLRWGRGDQPPTGDPYKAPKEKKRVRKRTEQGS